MPIPAWQLCGIKVASKILTAILRLHAWSQSVNLVENLIKVEFCYTNNVSKSFGNKKGKFGKNILSF